MLDDDYLLGRIRVALDEDLAHGDVTTACLDASSVPCRAELIARESMVLAGLRVAELTFRAFDPELSWQPGDCVDGATVDSGAIVARLTGTIGGVLAAERTALNFMQRMCGIATVTAGAVAEVEGTGAAIVDTRKTVPGLRRLDKYAVRVGGGRNHRFGLYDGILLKDNHLALCGGAVEAVRAARANAAHHLVRVEVEVETPDDAERVAEAGADVVLLDNMSVGQVAESVRRIDGRARVEVSGGLRPGGLRPYAETGADFLSIGWLTHSVRAADLSLEIAAERA